MFFSTRHNQPELGARGCRSGVSQGPRGACLVSWSSCLCGLVRAGAVSSGFLILELYTDTGQTGRSFQLPCSSSPPPPCTLGIKVDHIPASRGFMCKYSQILFSFGTCHHYNNSWMFSPSRRSAFPQGSVPTVTRSSQLRVLGGHPAANPEFPEKQVALPEQRRKEREICCGPA